MRYGFYGYEAQRILRKKEIKVMVRYPLEQRRTVGYLENMLIRTPTGTSVPSRPWHKFEKRRILPQLPVLTVSGRSPSRQMPTKHSRTFKSGTEIQKITCHNYRPSILKSKPRWMAAVWMNRLLWSV